MRDENTLIKLKEFIIVLMGVAFYHGVLCWSYNNVFLKKGTFFAVTDKGFTNLFDVFFIILLSFLPIWLLPLNGVRPMTWFLWAIYIFVISPALLFSLIILNRIDLIWLSVLIIGFLIANVIYKIPPIKVPKLSIKKWPTFLLWSLWIFCNGYIISKHGFKLNFISFSYVYEVRILYRAVTNRLTEYFVNWLGNVLNIFLTIYGLRYPKWRIAIPLALISQINLYSLTGYKSLIFYFAIVIVGYIFIFVFPPHYLKRLPIYSPWLAACSLLVLVILGNVNITFIGLADRFFLAPGVLTNLYYTFFNENLFAYLGHSILKGLISYPYTTTPDFIIGELFFKSGTRANANIYADGFANFGYLGVLLAGIGLGVLLWIIKTLSKSYNDSKVIILLSVPHIITLLNAPLLTSLITHGIILYLVLLFCFNF